MLFSLVFNILSAAMALLYPGYASYKTLSRRPADEAELERWLMYWSVLASLLAVEQVFPLIFIFPFYSSVRLIFLLYLALPQAQGATYIYSVHLRPLLLHYERDIDGVLERAKQKSWQQGKLWLNQLWELISRSLGASSGAAGTSSAAGSGGAGTPDLAVPAERPLGAAHPPTLNDPLAGPAQIVGGLWRAYGPSIIASGAAFVQRQQTAFAASTAEPPQAASRSASGATIPLSDTESVLRRRRELEAELAFLRPLATEEAAPSFPVPHLASTSAAMPAFPQAPQHPLPSPGGSISSRGSSAENGERKYEKIDRDDFSESEVSHEGPHNTPRPGPQGRTSWFGWGSPTDKPKTD
ncbi:hypothetical protein SISNIDRAFT_475938 [Sistotremastrum niveocremeum HHB9708]|uniref:Protein YOP1 n=1 Tax=Sistotremastrum niveocremeum HHB9708 TaxID=1314777 RepID=A0A164PCA8_9AGAM|nr:hypothetical protein SISNIDRAFT_475938 [Sistotremastrum niveocremeum HHB9708]